VRGPMTLMIWRDQTTKMYALTPMQRGIGPDESGEWVYVGEATLPDIVRRMLTNSLSAAEAEWR